MSPRGIGRVFLWIVLAITAPQSAAPQSAPTLSNVPPLPPDIPVDATRCSVLMMGTLAGQQATWTTPDGKLHTFFQFNDRGRGPKTSTVFTLGKNGNPVAEVIKGNDYLKTEVDEDFFVEGETAHWNNRAEQGKKKAIGNAFYVSMNGAPRSNCC